MFGNGAIIGIAFRIISNLDQIKALWGKIEPMIRGATGLSGDVKDLISKIAPGLLDRGLAQQEEPFDPLTTGAAELDGPENYSAEWLQVSLNSLMGAELEIDGDIGEETRKVVREYQESRGLEVDGWAGAGTQARILADLEAIEHKIAP